MKPLRWLDVAILALVLLLALSVLLTGRFGNPFEALTIAFGDWAQAAVDWLTRHARPFFQASKLPLKVVLDWVMASLTTAPPTLVILVMFTAAWQLGGLRLGSGVLVGLILLGVIGAWSDAMITLSLTISSVLFCVILGIPLGIAMAKSLRLAAIIRPILDIMQTCPAFVYLIPIVMLLGIGNVPGLAVTIIFALPPVVRLTDLGIRQVPESIVEAARAFGATPREILLDVELPLALPAIMTGVNQTLMMALSMVVVASMIAVEGLGLLVLRGIGRLDIALAATGGLGIVTLAVLLDRLTQAAAKPGSTDWGRRGPIGIIRALLSRLAGDRGPRHGTSMIERRPSK